MLAIYKREVRSYFNSMIGCVFAAFLTIIGGVYFMVYNLYSGYPFFAYSLAGVIFMLLISVPVLSMKSFAEDRKNKTDQLLLMLQTDSFTPDHPHLPPHYLYCLHLLQRNSSAQSGYMEMQVSDTLPPPSHGL